MAGLLAASAVCLEGGPARAGEIRAASGSQSLGTLVNGGASCSSGACAVSGGTAAGGSLFHRFAAFDTRGSITGVNIQNAGFGAVIVGVTSPLGSFIDKPVSLSQPGQLFWLSPGGIALSGGASFPNALQLNLTTATGLRIGSGQFDVERTTSQQASALGSLPGRFVTEVDTIGSLGLLANGDLSIDGGLLTVEQALFLDAQGGHLLLDGTQLRVPGGSIALSGSTTSLHNTLVDVNASAIAAGRVVVESRVSTLLSGATQVRAEGERGGAIDLLGRTVTLTDQTLVQASGERGGGSIRIGGDYLGGNPAVINAWQTQVGPEVQVLANATVNGDGGRVIVWADDTTRMQGAVQARGGPAGGNGGFIETSGKRLLSLGSVTPDASSTNGTPGTWLLDPGDLYVVSSTSGARLGLAGGQGVDVVYIAVNPADATIVDTDIENALNGGTSVLLKADNNIYVDAQIDYSPSVEAAPVRLSLQAGGSIFLNQGVDSSSPLDLLLDATTGNIAVSSAVVTAGGQFAARAGGAILIGAQGLDVSSGQVLLRATGNITADLTARRVAAFSESGDIGLAMQTPVGLSAVEIGPILIDSFFGASLFATGVNASQGRFGLSVDGGDGDLYFVGSGTAPFNILAGGTTDPDGSLPSIVNANRIGVESGTRLTISDVPGSFYNDPMQLNAAVEVRPGASLIVANDGGSQVDFSGAVLNQGLLSIESGASITLPASATALELAPGSTLSGGGTIAGVPSTPGSPLTGVLQRGPGEGAAGAVLSPGEGDGRRSLGSLTFENVAFQVEAGAVWQFDLGSGSAGAVDSIAFPSSTTLFVGGVPEVVVGLQNPSSPPPLQSFTLSPDLDVFDVVAAMNSSLRLNDGVGGTLESGSLLFVYQSQSSGGGGGGGPVPPTPGPVPPGPVPPGPVPPGPGPTPSRSDLNLEQLLIALGTLEPPIIPGNDVKPRPSSLPNGYSDALASLSINIAESFMGAILSDAAVELSSNLDRSISIPSVPTGVPSATSFEPSAGAADVSLVLSLEDSSSVQAMRSFQDSEIRRAADVTSKLSVKAPPVSAPGDLTLPTLRDQLEQAAKIVSAGAGGEGR